MKWSLATLGVGAILLLGCGSDDSEFSVWDAYVVNEDGWPELDISRLPGVPDAGSQDVDCRKIGIPVHVLGGDRYGLDEDGDGIGCEEYLLTDEEIRDAVADANSSYDPKYP